MVAMAAAVSLLLSGCGGGDDAEVEALKDRVAELEQSPSAAVATAPATPAPEEPVEPAPAAAPEPPATVDFVMPSFSGVNLQDAQDQVQALGVFFSVSHDLLGSRSQVLDGNWQVCDQTPAAGTQVNGPASEWEGEIDFGAVKLNEVCP